jgi:hypothetical protein
LGWQLDTYGLFPDICTKSGKWFRAQENCFAGTDRTTHSMEKPNAFRITASRARTGPMTARGVVHWPSASDFCCGAGLNRPAIQRDSRRQRATLWAVGALYPSISRGIVVVGNGNIDVGSTSPTRKTGKPIVEQMKGSGRSEAGNPKQMQAGQPNCGAMSQQGSFSYHGNVSSPQQLLHLVGCRDPKARVEPRVEPWTRPAPQRR